MKMRLILGITLLTSISTTYAGEICGKVGAVTAGTYSDNNLGEYTGFQMIESTGKEKTVYVVGVSAGQAVLHAKQANVEVCVNPEGPKHHNGFLSVRLK